MQPAVIDEMTLFVQLYESLGFLVFFILLIKHLECLASLRARLKFHLGSQDTAVAREMEKHSFSQLSTVKRDVGGGCRVRERCLSQRG